MSKIKHLLIIVGCVIGLLSGGGIAAAEDEPAVSETGDVVNTATDKLTDTDSVPLTDDGARQTPSPGDDAVPSDNATTDSTADTTGSAAAKVTRTQSQSSDALSMDARAVAVTATEKTKTKKQKSGPAWVATPKHEGIFLLSFPVSAYWRNDNGMDLFTEKAALLNVGANAEVTLATIHKKWRISLAGTWLAERAESTKVLGGRFHTTWAADMFVLGAKLRYSLLPWLSPHLRLYGGVETTSAKMKEPGAKYTSPRDYGAAVGGALGASIHTRSYKRNKAHGRFPVASIGLLLEAGYEYRAPVTLRFVDADTSPYAIDTELFSAGKLDRKSPFVRLDAFIRF